MASADEDTQRAALEAQLVRALTGQGEPPEGFDPARVQAAAEALARKRARAVARAWPALTRALADSYGKRFAAFAATRPVPREGGPLADGRAFARWLAAAGELPDPGRLEALAVDLRYARCGGGLVPRRGPVLRAARLRHARRLVLALRMPGLGEWWLSVRLGPSTRSG
jgi:hypothetical protein